MSLASGGGRYPHATDPDSASETKFAKSIRFLPSQKIRTHLELRVGGTQVEGRVTDMGGGPVRGVRITAKQDIEDASFVTLTDADGKYQLGVRAGRLHLEATHDAYRDAIALTFVAGCCAEQDFVLIPGGVIRGRVVTKDGSSVPGARISAHGSDEFSYEFGTADDDGEFTVRNLAAGAISVTATAHGYAATGPITVEMGVGEERNGVRVVVDRAFAITGRVVLSNAHDHAIAGMGVEAFGIDSGVFVFGGGMSDANGAFAIEGVRPGRYVVLTYGRAAVSNGNLTHGPYVAITDHDATDVIVELGLGFTVNGRIEPPAAGVRVSLDADGGAYWSDHGETGPDGRFSLLHVPASRYVLVAAGSDGRGGRSPITVADRDLEGLVVPIAMLASASGRVVESDGSPVAGARVDAVNGFTTFGSTATDRAGKFRLTGIQPGLVQLNAAHSGERFGEVDGPLPSAELVAGSEWSGVMITIPARSATIHGTVVDANGAPVGDAWVTAQRTETDPSGSSSMFSGYRTRPSVTSADGTFSIDHVVSGSYNVEVDGPRGGSHASALDVATGVPVTLKLVPMGAVSGVVMVGGQPAHAYRLRCMLRRVACCADANNEIDRWFQSDDGHYSLDHLAPGPYSCRINADEGLGRDKFEVPPGPLTHDIQVPRFGSLSGIVVDGRTGSPLSGVSINEDGESGNRAFNDSLAGKRPLTDTNGRFVLDHIAPGEGRLFVQVNDASARLLGGPFKYNALEGQRVDVGTLRIEEAKE